MPPRGAGGARGNIWVRGRGVNGGRKQIVQKKFPVAADHLNEVGWRDLNGLHGAKTLLSPGARERYETSIREVYRDIARELRDRFPL